MKHQFSLRAEWTGNQGSGTSGYKDYRRDVTLQAAGPGEISGSSARAFHGDESRWNPEQLLLGALAQCHTLSYLHHATAAGVVVSGLAVAVEGTLEVDSSGAGRMSAATLRPEVWLADEAQREQADALHEPAHRDCFIANSLSFPVELAPQKPRQMPQLPEFSSRLGAPIAVVRPRTANRPSQVSGLKERPTEVEPVMRADRPSGAEQTAARDAGPATRSGDQPQLMPASLRPSAAGTPTTADRAATPSAAAAAPAAPGQATSFYEAVGGHETFAQLTRVFYENVRQDPLLAPMYPQDDWEGSEARLRMFLEQYWGGPRTYSEQRGHPRLRMRHMPFKVDFAARDAWLRHMRTAVDSLDLAPLQEAELWDYLERAAHSMVNSA